MGACSLLEYVQENQISRSKILLPYNLISFVEQGEKSVYHASDKVAIGIQSFAILRSGKYLMTEKLPADGSYRSTMLLFDNSLLSHFFVKHAAIADGIPTATSTYDLPFAVFEKDPFIIAFIKTLKLINTKPTIFSEKIMEIKFEELMLHLLEKYPNEVLSLRNKHEETYTDFELRKAVELNINNNLSLEELAFLCNTSAATFKRRFVKLYGENPSSYFLRKRMDYAKELLLHENPSEVYFKLGYENHSSFSKSFKQVFGLSPKQFKLQN